LFYAETDQGLIKQIGADLSRDTFVEGLTFPQALAFDVEGNLYVVTGPEGFVPDPSVNPGPVSGNRIVRISPEGEVSTVASVDGANGLAVSPAGNLFVSVGTLGSPRTVSTVMRIPPGGSPTVFATGFEDSTGLAFDLAGNLYVADEKLNAIVRIGGFPQGTVSGQVMDAAGQAVAGARVQVLAIDPIVAGAVVYADEQGQFSLAAAPGRTYRVVVSMSGYQTATLEDVVVMADEETVVEFVLQR
jgi:sugar lactone lactonase YvrE